MRRRFKIFRLSVTFSLCRMEMVLLHPFFLIWLLNWRELCKAWMDCFLWSRKHVNSCSFLFWKFLFSHRVLLFILHFLLNMVSLDCLMSLIDLFGDGLSNYDCWNILSFLSFYRGQIIDNWFLLNWRFRFLPLV